LGWWEGFSLAEWQRRKSEFYGIKSNSAGNSPGRLPRHPISSSYAAKQARHRLFKEAALFEGE